MQKKIEPEALALTRQRLRTLGREIGYYLANPVRVNVIA